MEPWKHFNEKIEELNALRSVMELISWDQETYMPPKGIAQRSKQSATLAAILHDKLTAKEWGDVLGRLNEDTNHKAHETY